MDRRLFLGTAAATLALPSVALGAEVEPTLVVQWPAEVPPWRHYRDRYATASCLWQELFFQVFVHDRVNPGDPLVVARDRHSEFIKSPALHVLHGEIDGYPVLRVGMRNGHTLDVWTPQLRYGLVVQKQYESREASDPYFGETLVKVARFLSPRLEHR